MIDFDHKVFGERLAAALAAQKWTQASAARACGVEQSRLSGYCTGSHTPSLRVIVHLIDCLDLDPRIFFPDWCQKARLLDEVDDRRDARRDRPR